MLTIELKRPLTARERQVLDLLLEFKCYKEIAVALGIEVRTAKFHACEILHKFNVCDRSELLALHYPNPPVRYAR